MNILTFDIEEWFHILDNSSTKSPKEWENYSYRLDSNMDRIFELLDKHDQKATFFCLGWVAKKFPHIIRKIDALGYEIGSHSDLHQLVYEQSKSIFSNDLERSISTIQELTGKKVISYRAPGFSITEDTIWALEALAKHEIEIDCSIFPSSRNHGGFLDYGDSCPKIIDIDGMKIKELPINVANFLGKDVIFSGGGYFRLLPYYLIRHMFNKSDYTMTYFHPRDFDSEQPVIQDLSMTRKFRSYVGLSRSLVKLDRLLGDFDFLDLREANSRIDWETVSTLKLK